jgi:hypothetical protein
VFGVVWGVFVGVLFWFAGFKPIFDALGAGEESTLDYLNRTGITFTILVVVVGIVIYVIQAARNRARGIDTSLMYQQLPPD